MMGRIIQYLAQLGTVDTVVMHIRIRGKDGPLLSIHLVEPFMKTYSLISTPIRMFSLPIAKWWNK